MTIRILQNRIERKLTHHLVISSAGAVPNPERLINGGVVKYGRPQNAPIIAAALKTGFLD
jgi:hypothetical protein